MCPQDALPAGGPYEHYWVHCAPRLSTLHAAQVKPGRAGSRVSRYEYGRRLTGSLCEYADNVPTFMLALAAQLTAWCGNVEVKLHITHEGTLNISCWGVPQAVLFRHLQILCDDAVEAGQLTPLAQAA